MATPTDPSIGNRDIASLFYRLADLLEIEDENEFRVRAYRNAARIIATHPEPLAVLVARDADLKELPGIGAAIAEKIATIVRTGRLPALEKAARDTPLVLSDLMRIPGLGPKRVKTLHEKLKIRRVADLERALARGLVRKLPGFGEKTEQLIIEGLPRAAAAEARQTPQPKSSNSARARP